MASGDRVSRFGTWFRQTAAGAARAMGTPAGVSADTDKGYCPSRNGIPDFTFVGSTRCERPESPCGASDSPGTTLRFG